MKSPCTLRYQRRVHGDFMLTGSTEGHVHYWQSNMVCIKEINCHDNNSVRQISLSCADSKFCTASDDGSLKIWDLETQDCDATLSGHGHSVTCCDWHPSSALVASGSNDKYVKLWDPRARDGRPSHCVGSTMFHRNTVLKVKWNLGGHTLLTSGKDCSIKLIDIRTMNEVFSFEGHKKDVTSIDWHPVQPDLFASGCADGSLMYWLVGHRSRSEPGSTIGANQWTNAAHNHGKEVCHPVAEVPVAHCSHHTNNTIWDVKWHPLGHMLATVGNDVYCKIWGRCKAGQGEDVKELRSDGTVMQALPSFQKSEGGAGWQGQKTWRTGPAFLRPQSLSVDNRKPADSKMTVTFDDEDED
eukprot:NODE_3259_length_1250_cov_153.883762_g3094_i0.p1 GENE.NODE_3259_length_1250_cov_153.883762_g3094_i0~~NODE_3259_length_1250_cov_153.883762_g3094_i0.p1  ORF type:complete len:355 (-),score=42.72 NODE_3259_length_1250_cov_153.883762_g3094_i0:130-1194(-)